MQPSILECEACGFGYPIVASACPYCGAGAWLAHTIPLVRRRCDTECYRDYWLCRLDNPPQDFQLLPGGTLDTVALRRALSLCQVVTFNGTKYDGPMISGALLGWNNQQLKQLSDAIILQNLQPWDLERQYGIPLMQWDHIDLFEVAPGQGSLKAYGGKMHAPKLQDLPIEPGASIALFDRPLLREYCQNDLDTTHLLEQAMSAQIKLREEISTEYGIDVRSKSDAQIAEAVMKRTLGFKVVVPDVPAGTMFYYRPPPWMRFVSQPLLELMARNPFTVDYNGSVKMSDELSRTVIRIGRSAYRMGSGGLHSTEENICWVADDNWVIRDSDVTGYYPSLIEKTGIYPQQIGPIFQQIYSGWIAKRNEAKAKAAAIDDEIRRLKEILADLPNVVK